MHFSIWTNLVSQTNIFQVVDRWNFAQYELLNSVQRIIKLVRSVPGNLHDTGIIAILLKCQNVSKFVSQLPLQASTPLSLVSVTPQVSECVYVVKSVVCADFDTSVTCISPSETHRHNLLTQITLMSAS